MDQPSDNTTLLDVLDGYRTAGFVTDFFAEEGATVRCAECQSTIDARRMAMESMRRMEGASDPADMLMIVAITCPVCSATGTMVLGYGPAASAADSEVSAAIGDHRDEDDELPRDAAPDELPDT